MSTTETKLCDGPALGEPLVGQPAAGPPVRRRLVIALACTLLGLGIVDLLRTKSSVEVDDEPAFSELYSMALKQRRSERPLRGFRPAGREFGLHQNPAMPQTEVVRAQAIAEKEPITDELKADAEKVKEWERLMVVDEASKLAASDFPIKPEELITKAKTFLAYDQGVSKPELLASDFEFVGPVVGPLPKEVYLKAVGGFNLQEVFPDFNAEFHHFRVDPFEPYRVWFTARGYGTNTGSSNAMFGEPSGQKYVNPPQSCSLRFDPDGKVNQYTIGYVMDRRIGNTGGLGGVFGIAYAMGKALPFPEAQPWKPSKRYRFFTWFGNFIQSLRTDKKDDA